MRLSGLAGFCILLLASQSLVGCGDDDGGGTSIGGSSGDGGSSSGKGGKASAGDTSKSGSATAGSGGTFGTAGTFSTAGTDAAAGDNSGGSSTAGTAGSGGSGGSPVVPNCMTNDECADTNPCTDDACKNGDCVHTNNTATCDDGNACTSTDVCTAGACLGTNNTDACDDLSACTTGDKCFGGLCNGTRNLVACPTCLDPNNIIQNCDFSNGTDQWHDDFVFEGGGGTQHVVNGRLVIDITSGGNFVYSVQPRQSPILLKKGMKYKIRMLVGSSVDRDIVIGLTQDHGSYTVYSTGDNAAGGFTLALTKQMKQFEFEFTMTADDDPVSKLELKIGGPDVVVPSSVYFDDIAVIEEKCGNNAACNDSNECTADACDVARGTCSWTNTTAACTADASDCTNDVCAAGVCTHPKLVDDTACATDNDNCTADVCAAGACTHTFDTNVCACQKDLDCNDNNACTDDTCNAGTCANTNNTAACDDNNACTSTDVCAAGVCAGADNTAACDDNNVCTVPDACAAGACSPGTNVCYDCTTVVGNLLANCDLAAPLSATGWVGDLFFNGAVGDQSIKNGELAVHITTGGAATYQVQPRQIGLVLVKGTTYVVQFNARATMNRNIDFSITQDGGGFAPYAGAHTFALTPQMGAYTFEFTMTADPPAEKVKYEFDLGGDPNTVENTVYLDNLSIAPKP